MSLEKTVDVRRFLESWDESLQDEYTFDEGGFKTIGVASRLEGLTVAIFLIALDMGGRARRA